MTNVEIEDVLSSIRRLVADEPRKRDTLLQDSDDAPAKPAGKLVLTPAQRVTVPGDAVEDLAEPAQTEPAPQVDSPTDDSAADDMAAAPLANRTLVEVEALARQLLAQTDPARQEDILNGIRTALFAHRAPMPEMPAETAKADVVPEVETAAEDGLFDDLPDLSVAVTSDTAVAPEAEPLTLTTLAHEESALELTALLEPVHESEVAPEPEAEPEQESPSAAASLEDKIAELEALIGRGSGNWDPDADDRGGNAAAELSQITAMPWDDNAEPEGKPEAVQDTPKAFTIDVSAPDATDDSDDAAPFIEVDGTGPEGDETIYAPRDARPNWAGLHVVHSADETEEETTIDEDQLHELVSRIVREELQGVLGERITRNVRKLVRREIQRALAGHDLD
ncbi:hypothetical protein VK792_07780 [Mesobacterium sp. TK19101]|uniref:Uncharacterized protein n=1 Tax=Mesobacterium hydrothermale TaxID=3111907 RepID=A0ABU6HFD9_9RHOB|nr:hypothetical protein [Mesobacterium sp. TK19101]